MKTVVIFGGSGFVGSHIIAKIIKHDYRIIVPYQESANEEKIRFLENEGKITRFKFNKLNDPKIAKFIEEAEVVLNLKTIWNEKNISYEKGIYQFNCDLINLINNIDNNKSFIFFSGLGVDKNSFSKRTEAIAKTEEFIHFFCKNSSIIRPGVIIGGGDKFLKRLLPIFKYSLLVPLFGDGLTKFQPVHIDDITSAVEGLIFRGFYEQNIFELAGKEVFSYKSFYSLICKSLNIKRFFIPIPFFLLKFPVYLLEKTSINIINSEQLILFQNNNLLSKKEKEFKNLNIEPQKISDILKIYIKKC